MTAYHIYLLRHGATEANARGQYVGRTDLPLSPEGGRELKTLAETCSYPPAELFFASPLRRCVQTLEILYPGAEPSLLPDLAECDFGSYEGKTFEELQDDPGYQKWIASAGTSAPPGGESGVQFQARCCRGFAALADTLMRSGRHSAVVAAHGGTIMSILSTFGLPRRPFYDWMCGFGRGFETVLVPQLWANGKIIEVTAALPEEPDSAGEPADEEGL